MGFYNLLSLQHTQYLIIAVLASIATNPCIFIHLPTTNTKMIKCDNYITTFSRFTWATLILKLSYLPFRCYGIASPFRTVPYILKIEDPSPSIFHEESGHSSVSNLLQNDLPALLSRQSKASSTEARRPKPQVGIAGGVRVLFNAPPSLNYSGSLAWREDAFSVLPPHISLAPHHNKNT